MPSPEKRTFSLPAEQADYIDTLVASGSYASGSEVVRTGLRALQERDATVEKWLREEVASVCDAMQSDPGLAIPSEKVFATIRARHADRLKKRRDAHRIEFSPEALGDLIDLYDYIAVRDGAERAIKYIDRIQDFCRALSVFPDRGARHDELRPGLQILGFERRAVIAFQLTTETVNALDPTSRFRPRSRQGGFFGLPAAGLLYRKFRYRSFPRAVRKSKGRCMADWYRNYRLQVAGV